MPDAIIGIDPDTKRITAVVTVDGVPKLRRKVLPTSTSNARGLDVAWRWVYQLVKEYTDLGFDVHIGIESPFVSPKTVQAAIPLGRLNGTMLAAAQRAGAVSIHEVVIQSWKKDVCGNGSAGKPQVALWCKVYWLEMWKVAQRYTKAERQQDICGASAINRHVNNLVTKMKNIEKFYEQHPEEAAAKQARRKRLVK